MRHIFFVGAIMLLIVGGVLLSMRSTEQPLQERSRVTPAQDTQNKKDIPATSVIAESLDTPWAIAFLPGSGSELNMLITERAGRVRLIENGTLQEQPVVELSQVNEIGEGGLLGITLHPDFVSNHFVYLYYTYHGAGSNTLNRVVRMRYENKQLSDQQTIIDRIPGGTNHDGGRIKFGPDGFLYVATGDGGEPSLAQDKNSLAGKILRVTDEGKAASGNSFGNTVYSYGHRNPQGLAWDRNGRMWSTEHGPSGGQYGSGQDELNQIEMGKNYGWPTIIGDNTSAGMETPAAQSGSDTWAPSGLAATSESLYFAGLRGQALYSIGLQSDTVQEYFNREFGRIREVILGPDGMLYITTSNRDGRGSPKKGDDKIIRVNPQKL